MKLLIVVLAMMLSACSDVTPGAGEEAVLVYKPYLFGNNAIDPTPVTTGRTYVALSTDSVMVNMQPQRVDLVFDDLMTSSGVPIDFHAVMTFVVTDSVKLVSKFGADLPGVFKRNLEQPFSTAVRDAVKKRDMQDMAITASAAEAVDAEVTAHMEKLITEYGVPVLLKDLSLGKANPPDAIKNQRIKTAEQEQRIITEQQTKLAEDQRKGAEESRAAADAAYNYKMQLSPQQYLELERIKMQERACAKGPCTFFFDAPNVLVGAGR